MSTIIATVDVSAVTDSITELSNAGLATVGATLAFGFAMGGLYFAGVYVWRKYFETFAQYTRRREREDL